MGNRFHEDQCIRVFLPDSFAKTIDERFEKIIGKIHSLAIHDCEMVRAQQLWLSLTVIVPHAVFPPDAHTIALPGAQAI